MRGTCCNEVDGLLQKLAKRTCWLGCSTHRMHVLHRVLRARNPKLIRSSLWRVQRQHGSSAACRPAPSSSGTGWTTLKATAWQATPCCSRACRAPERRTWPEPLGKVQEQGKPVHLVLKTHCSAQNLGLGAQTDPGARYVRGAARWTGWWWRRLRS